jgi:hypothetical protein
VGVRDQARQGIGPADLRSRLRSSHAPSRGGKTHLRTRLGVRGGRGMTFAGKVASAGSTTALSVPDPMVILRPTKEVTTWPRTLEMDPGGAQ